MWITIFWWLVRWFAKDFHSWLCHCENHWQITSLGTKKSSYATQRNMRYVITPVINPRFRIWVKLLCVCTGAPIFTMLHPCFGGLKIHVPRVLKYTHLHSDDENHGYDHDQIMFFTSERHVYDDRLRFIPVFKDLGSILILGQVTQYGNPY